MTHMHTPPAEPGRGEPAARDAMTGNQILDELPHSVQRSVHKFLITLDSGDKAETATVGRDGFVGVPLILGGAVSDAAGVIQVSGDAYRMTARSVLDLCKQHETFRRALFGY